MVLMLIKGRIVPDAGGRETQVDCNMLYNVRGQGCRMSKMQYMETSCNCHNELKAAATAAASGAPPPNITASNITLTEASRPSAFAARISVVGSVLACQLSLLCHYTGHCRNCSRHHQPRQRYFDEYHLHWATPASLGRCTGISSQWRFFSQSGTCIYCCSRRQQHGHVQQLQQRSTRRVWGCCRHGQLPTAAAAAAAADGPSLPWPAVGSGSCFAAL